MIQLTIKPLRDSFNTYPGKVNFIITEDYVELQMRDNYRDIRIAKTDFKKINRLLEVEEE